ncbi:MFS transporter [Actinomadura roseirufa]|uniref:MFS transporter n=1 Tax=Actinomadura roseirufa TaxID=2094049 RepID=UPI001A954ED9|nr:MFS transporter [Actinomadura roseirufa]
MSTNRATVATMAVATGAVIANLYYAQPLEETLGRQFGVSTGAVGIVLTLIQVGYAVGLATLVPLGDLLERRRLLAVMLAGGVAGLAGMALAPSYAAFGAAAVLVGLTSVAAQIIVPFAAHIAGEGRQGRVVGTVMSGLLLGILLSRTVAGLVASALGWRAVFGLGAVVTAVVGVLLWVSLPKLAPTARMRYPALLGSVLSIVREEPALRLRIVYGALCFASFSVFWASAGFLLARAPYDWNDAQIGAFALLGAAGALVAKVAGRLADRGLARYATGAFLVAMAGSYALLGLGAHDVVALGAGVAVMDLGCQGVHISNQSLIYPLRPEARSRINTAYMTVYFVAGAVGTALSTVLYASYGWTGVSALGAALPAAATAVWLVEIGRRGAPAKAAPAADRRVPSRT